MAGYLTIAVFLVTFSLVAERLSRTVVTAPMVFLGFGALVAEGNLLPAEGSREALYVLAEIALVVLLFLDAAKTDTSALLRQRVSPARMLVVGMPLAFLFGTGLGLLVLPGWPPALVAVAAAILVPTDAALGQPVITNPDIPERPRSTLTVESGLNDGLALPFVLLVAALAASMTLAPPEGWALFALKQVTLGPLAGVVVGCIGAVALVKAQAAGTTSETYEGIGALALAAAAYTAATLVGGNGFVAAFAAGLGFGAIVKGRCGFVFEFTEGEGQLLSWGAFFLLGAVLVPQAAAHLSVETLAYILGSLVIVRPLAVWLSLVGSDATPQTRLFFGWFGPRGLATALFALLVAGQLAEGAAEDILYLAVNAVWISAVLHGLTAAPGARLYARRTARMAPEAELAPVPEPFGGVPLTPRPVTTGPETTGPETTGPETTGPQTTGKRP